MQKQLQEPFRGCFERLSTRLEESDGESGGRIFREALEEGMRELPLKREDRDAFLRFLPENGYMDGQMQLLSIQRSRNLLEDTIDRLERDNGEKCRLAVGLGAMSGMLLVLILW